MRSTISIFIVAFCLTGLLACQVKLWPDGSAEDVGEIKVERYDRLQSRYLTTGDFSALQSMSTTYPMETRTLIENVLQLGTVNQSDINERFLKFYRDTTLQHIIATAEMQYANMDDINEKLTNAFKYLRKEFPQMPVPMFYAQIGALDQSIIVGDGTVGISLDKYLGADYEAYPRYYPKQQIATMTRANIVPDCLTFYILSLYPLTNFDNRTQEERDAHIGKVMYVVNKALGEDFYQMPFVLKTKDFMRANPSVSVSQLLSEE